MFFNRIFILSLFALSAGIVSQASAGTVTTGTFSYTPAGQPVNDPTCPADQQQRVSFSGTVSEDGGFTDYALNFSICNTPGTIAGGEFALTGGVNNVDSVSGIFTGAFDGTTTIDSVVYEIEAGVFAITPDSGTGIFAGAQGSDNFTAYASQAGTGSFIIGAPEPATVLLTGLGIVAIGFSRRVRKSSPLA
jgi:hypothetical protein